MLAWVNSASLEILSRRTAAGILPRWSQHDDRSIERQRKPHRPVAYSKIAECGSIEERPLIEINRGPRRRRKAINAVIGETGISNEDDAVTSRSEDVGGLDPLRHIGVS